AGGGRDGGHYDGDRWRRDGSDAAGSGCGDPRNDGGQRAFCDGKDDVVHTRPSYSERRDSRKAGAVCGGPVVRGLSGAGGACLRSEHWTSVCGAGGGEYDDSGDDWHPGVWGGGAWAEGDPGTGPYEVRGGERCDERP